MKKPVKVRCKICQGDKFFVKTGYNICEKCGMSRGHVLGFLTKRNTSDFIFDKNLFISKNTIMKNRLEMCLLLFN